MAGNLHGGRLGERVGAHFPHSPLGLPTAHHSGDLLGERSGRRREPRRRRGGRPGERTFDDLERIVDAGESVGDHAAVRKLEGCLAQRIEVVPPFDPIRRPADRDDELVRVLAALSNEAVELRCRTIHNEVFHLDPGRHVEPGGKVAGWLRLEITWVGRIHAVCGLHELPVEGRSL